MAFKGYFQIHFFLSEKKIRMIPRKMFKREKEKRFENLGYGTMWIDEGIEAYMKTLTLAHWMNKRIKVNNKRVTKKNK